MFAVKLFIKTRKLYSQYSVTVCLGERSPSFMQSVRLGGVVKKREGTRLKKQPGGGVALSPS